MSDFVICAGFWRLRPAMALTRAELFEKLGIFCLVLFVVFAAVSVILFIRFRIPQVYGLLSGRTQERSIRRMQEENERSRTDIADSDKEKETDGQEAPAPARTVLLAPQEAAETGRNHDERMIR